MKLIVIDPHVTRKSPSMRAWVDAFPHCSDLFESVEIWASECDLQETATLRWKKFPQRLPTWTLHSLDYQWRINRALDQLPKGENVLIQVTGCTVPLADIRYIHFWNNALLEESERRPESLRLNLKQRVFTEKAARDERQAISTDQSWWWVVSDALAQRIQRQKNHGEFRILPNQYDPLKFNPSVKREAQAAMRAHYGFRDEDQVFAFSAFGHFERKGLRQAVEAISELRKRGHAAKLLVLGGTPKTIAAFRKTMVAHGISDNGIIFAGLVSEIQKHLSAADGFFFPSHFEAFSLAEIEAAALGLRLYLTPHYGHEMILREPLNGRLLPWDSHGMADEIEKDLLSEDFGKSHQELGEALTPDTYRTRLRQLYEEAISRKQSASAHLS